MAVIPQDLTIVYYTANAISDEFGRATRAELSLAAHDYPIISVSMKPMDFGENHVVSGSRSHINIYRQALYGAKKATTKYIALCEDDILYSPEHFKRRPSTDTVFAYNLGYWNIQTWGEPQFSHKAGGRRNLHSLICNRELFINAMEERFAKYPYGTTDLSVWAEPGKYEQFLGVTVQKTEEFYTNPPNIMFDHQTALSYNNLGSRKRLGEFRALELPYWGKAEVIRSLYKWVIYGPR